jgi:hypothetical protein
MKRIDTATKAVDLFGAGKHGFKDGNIGLGIAPTDLNASWFNEVQEEILSVIEGAGIVADGAQLNQLYQAMSRLAGYAIKTVTHAMSPYVVTADDAGLLLLDASAGDVAVTMPAAAGVKGRPFALRRVDSTANAVTIAAAGADTLDGAASAPLCKKGAWVHYRSNGVATFQAYGASTAVEVFQANASFTVPAGVSRIWITGVGGGGGGGGAAGSVVSPAGNAGGGGGGGSGTYTARSVFSVTPGQVLLVVIGAAGGAGAGGVTSVAGTNGSDGGASSVTVSGGATLITLAGGAHGVGGGNTGAGGAGGNFGGGYGDDGSKGGGGGAGGGGPLGTGASRVRGDAAAAIPATGNGGWGSGGGGGSACYGGAAVTGGAACAGAAGLVIIEY